MMREACEHPLNCMLYFYMYLYIEAAYKVDPPFTP